MATTDVILTNDSGVLVPSASSVPVKSGDVVTFAVADHGTAFLFFSPDAISVLSPSPHGSFEISGATKAAFTFTSSNAGAYSVYFETSASAKHPAFPVRESTSLNLEIDSTGQFSGPRIPIDTSTRSGTE